MRRLFPFIILIPFILTGCSEVNFDRSMPKNADVLAAFPKEITGKYFLDDSLIVGKDDTAYNVKYYSGSYKTRDSITLVSADVFIEKNMVYYNLKLKSYYDMNRVDTARVIEKHKNELKTIEDHYIIFNDREMDTIFNPAQKDELKSDHGRYYMNHFISKKDWEIFQLETINAGFLSINITNAKDLEELTKVAKYKESTFYKIFHLSDVQFADFVNKGGFREKYHIRKYGE